MTPPLTGQTMTNLTSPHPPTSSKLPNISIILCTFKMRDPPDYSLEERHPLSNEAEKFICGVHAPVFRARLHRILITIFVIINSALILIIYTVTLLPVPCSNLLLTFLYCRILSTLVSSTPHRNTTSQQLTPSQPFNPAPSTTFSPPASHFLNQLHHSQSPSSSLVATTSQKHS